MFVVKLDCWTRDRCFPRSKSFDSISNVMDYVDKVFERFPTMVVTIHCVVDGKKPEPEIYSLIKQDVRR